MVFVIYFTLIMTLLIIVIIRYRFLRATMQRRSEAVANILRRQSIEYIRKWIHFFLCRAPRETTQVANNGNVDTSMTTWVKMRINMNDILYGMKHMTKKEREEEIEKEFKEIEKKIARQNKERKMKYQIDADTNQEQNGETLDPNKMKEKDNSLFKKHWKELRSMLVFLTWFIITFIILFMQLSINKTYAETASKELISSSDFYLDLRRIVGGGFDFQRLWRVDLDYVIEERIMQTWVNDILIDHIYSNDYTILDQNYILNLPYLRVSVLMKDYNNTYGNEEYTEDITVDLDNGTNVLRYIPPGDSLTPLQEGGYVLNYNTDAAIAVKEDFLFDLDTKKLRILKENWYRCIHEFVHFNRNTQNYALHGIVLKRTDAGVVSTEYEMMNGRALYNTSLEYFRAFLEIIFFLFYLFYFYTTLRNLWKFYKLEVRKHFKIREDSTEKIGCLRYFGISFPPGVVENN